MAVFGIDQSSRPPPSAAALVKAGVKFANHYVADRWTQPVDLDDPSTWPTKCMRPAEVQAYVAAGIAMFTNWETSADAMRAGYDRGQSAAVGAAHMARLCGAPDDMAVFFSADWPATYDDYTGGIKPFLQGAHTKLGRNRVGKKRSALYGSVYVIQWAFEDGLIDYGWQTAAWSGRPPVWYPKAQLRQFPDAPNRYHVTIDGVICDIDHALAADFGQWGAQTSEETFMALSTDEEQEILRAARQINATAGPGTTNFEQTVEATLRTSQSLVNLIKGASGTLAGSIDSVRSAVLGAIAALPPPSVDVDEAAVAAQITQALQAAGVTVDPAAIAAAVRHDLAGALAA